MTRLVVTLCAALSIAGAELYVSPSGTDGGSGTVQSPLSLSKALDTGSPAIAGDTIWLLGGTYGMGSNVWYCRIAGTEESPIIVRQAPRNRAIVNGNIYCATPGNWVTFWGFELTCTAARTNLYANRPAGLVLSAQGHKARNLIVHNTGHPGITGGGSEIYGCVLWGVGIYEYDDVTTFPTNAITKGSALYLQNSGAYEYEVKDNISRGSFNAGMKAYAESGFTERFAFDGNIVLLNNGEGIELECINNSITNGAVLNNYTYRNLKNPIGYFSSDELAQHQSLLYSNNYDYGSPGTGVALLWIKRWRSPTIVNNTIITTAQTNEWFAGSGVETGAGGHFFELYPATNVLSYDIEGNSYYGGVEQDADWYSSESIFYHTYQPFRYKFNSVSPADGTNGLISFDYWRSSHGFDLTGTYTTNMPTSNVVTLRTNKYEAGRGHLVVFNWESNSVVNVDLSPLGYSDGQRFEVRDAQDYLGTPLIVTNFSASSPSIDIPLTSTNTSPITGDIAQNYTFNPNVHTASLFNVFVLKVAEDSIRPVQSRRNGLGGGLRRPF